VWKDYLRTRALDHYADLLPAGFRGEMTATRAERALTALKGTMGEGLGRMYVEKYLSPAQKARVQGVVANVVEAFARRVEASTWMAPATKAQAIAKIRALYVGIGYPERWQDFSGLAIDPADALGNVRRAEARNHALALAKLGRPMDRGEWWISPERPGGILMFQQNAYDFSAALLQPPKYDSTASEAATYGAIGAVIGHDVTHYVDLLGAEFELTGRERRWWTEEDLRRYETLARPMADQFSAYRPFPDVAVDGAKTRSENIADLAGLSAAFEAYRATLRDRMGDTAFVHAQDRAFFTAFAQSWRSQYTEGALRAQLATDTHAPDRYRIATVRNLDAWYEAFDVRPGQRLYLPPAQRVRVW
ncbi:MAG TPA: M13 family metallopeptidase, partial [Gemmatimonadales bacterium]